MLAAGGTLVVADMICHIPLADMNWGQWLSLRLVAAGAGIPSANLVSSEEYVEMLHGHGFGAT